MAFAPVEGDRGSITIEIALTIKSLSFVAPPRKGSMLERSRTKDTKVLGARKERPSGQRHLVDASAEVVIKDGQERHGRLGGQPRACCFAECLETIASPG